MCSLAWHSKDCNLDSDSTKILSSPQTLAAYLKTHKNFAVNVEDVDFRIFSTKPWTEELENEEDDPSFTLKTRSYGTFVFEQNRFQIVFSFL